MNLLTPRPPYIPAQKSATDTSHAAGESVGAIGALARELVGKIEDRAFQQRRDSVQLAITVRNEVMDYLRENPDGATADEIAYALKRSILTVRPRCSELARMNRIKDSTRRGVNASGHHAIIWVMA